MISQRCPKCRSSRVRRGYRPTPFLSKLIFRFNLLCDNCNWEFAGFAVPGTVTDKPKRRKKKSEAAPHREQKVSEVTSELTLETTSEKTLETTSEIKSEAEEVTLKANSSETAVPIETSAPIETAIKSETVTAKAKTVTAKSAPAAKKRDSAKTPKTPKTKGRRRDSMKTRILFFVICWSCPQILISGQTLPAVATTTTTTTTAPPAAEAKHNSPTAENLAHFGDLIDVDVVGNLEYDWRGTLTPEGFLDGLDFIESPIYALCRSEEEIARDVVKGYEKLLRAPQVAVKILDRSNRAAAILQGAVKKSQRFQIRRSVKLSELIVIAGGLTDRASGEIQIFRPANASCASAAAAAAAATNADVAAVNNNVGAENDVATRAANGSGATRAKSVKAGRNDENAQIINLRVADLLRGAEAANPQILSGDIISVAQADPIYIVGGVNNPTQISSRAQTTVSRAIAAAGGLTKDAVETSVIIFRRQNRETSVTEVDLTQIEAGTATDVPLKGFDIVEVGQRGREKRKYPPFVETDESRANDTAAAVKPTLRIID